MSKVAQITVEDMLTHGGKSLKELKRMVMGIEEDIGEPVSLVVIMSVQQFQRINMMLQGGEIFVQKTREVTGQLMEVVDKDNPQHQQIHERLAGLVALLTGGERKEEPSCD